MGEVQICRDPGGGALPGRGAERISWPEKMPVWSLGGTAKHTVRDGQLRKQKEWERWCACHHGPKAGGWVHSVCLFVHRECSQLWTAAIEEMGLLVSPGLLPAQALPAYGHGGL